MKVTHRCDVPACANPRHLVLRTQRGNMMDGLERGRPIICAPGEKNFAARLTEADIRLIRASAMRSGDLASRLGVSRATIDAARRRITWRHVE
ncbi:hypothetical protein [Skermanella sp. TT6]|uniref:hypothetical protein n=1 Tax=Skermanella cutis TaxID=2775420 RepID=UPI0035304E4D